MTFNATDRSKADTSSWLTPLAFVRALGHFDLDPCGWPGYQTADHVITLPANGLEADWQGRVWLNPPYGKQAAKWLHRLREHGDGIALVFARLETGWLMPYLENGFFQIQGRISFIRAHDGFIGRSGAASILIPFGRKNLAAILSSDIPGRWFQ